MAGSMSYMENLADEFVAVVRAMLPGVDVAVNAVYATAGLPYASIYIDVQEVHLYDVPAGLSAQETDSLDEDYMSDAGVMVVHYPADILNALTAIRRMMA
jgi:hypothetical protein